MKRWFAQVVCYLLAVALCAAAGQAQAGQAQAGQPAAGQDASAAKPPNPLEIKPPGPGEDKASKEAYKALQHFQSIPDSDAAKKTQAGEDFLNKFASSSYAHVVYQYLTIAYIQAGQVDKGVTTGEKDLQVSPADYRTMAVLSQTMSRTANDQAPDASAKLTKAESYAKNAIAGVDTWVKPDAMSDANFAALKNDTLSMGHSTLGLVAIHRGNFEGAIPDLQQAVQLGSNTDPTNYYLLGLANQNSGHYDQSSAAFEKCAAVKGTNLTGTCQTLLEQAKKDAAQGKPKP
jgi:tetratricopeptide (TPR) repeat protein